MQYTTSHPAPARRAIILFVRDERREGEAKPLPVRYRSGGYAALNRRIIARLQPLLAGGADLLLVSEGSIDTPAAAVIMQRGESFGERISNAAADAFALGYDEVAVVGNDCPTLAPADVAAAFQRLSCGASLAAAPARDGGAYLIALRAGGINLWDFRNLPWQTPELFRGLLSLCGACAIPVLRDDFDCWTTEEGRRALDDLFEAWLPAPAAVIISSPVPSSALRKARTRNFLPAPPPRFSR